MHKSRMIVFLATLACALAAASTPASAYFAAKAPGTTKGPIVKLPASTTLSIGTSEFKCTRNIKSTGFWNIQTSEEQIITKGTKQQQQPGTKVGPHEAITITDWGDCIALGLTAKVSPCRLQVAQSKGAEIAHASVQTDCVIEISAAICTIIVDQQKENHDLQSVFVEDDKTLQNVILSANVTGITFKTVGAGCATAGLPAEGHNATFKTGVNGNESIELEQQKVI